MEILNCDSDGKFLVKDDSPTSTSEGIHLVRYTIMVNVIVGISIYQYKVIVIIKQVF